MEVNAGVFKQAIFDLLDTLYEKEKKKKKLPEESIN